jgi:hypothetical protein
MTYNFQTECSKIKLLTKYESLPLKVLRILESILQNANELQLMSLISKLPGFDQRLPAKYSVFQLLFGADHNQSLEIALNNVGYHYLNVGLSHIQFCNDVAF